MIYYHKSKFKLGEKVKMGEISGVVQLILFHRNSTSPSYKVEWWHQGEVYYHTFYEEELE